MSYGKVATTELATSMCIKTVTQFDLAHVLCHNLRGQPKMYIFKQQPSSIERNMSPSKQSLDTCTSLLAHIIIFFLILNFTFNSLCIYNGIKLDNLDSVCHDENLLNHFSYRNVCTFYYRNCHCRNCHYKPVHNKLQNSL